MKPGRAFLVVTILSMTALIMIAPLMEYANAIRETPIVWWGGRCFSAAIGGILTYVVVRLFQIVGSDLSILGEQSKFMVRAVGREAEKQRMSALPTEIRSDFKTPENYGHRIQ
jgi:hypothetical protein